MNVELPQTLVIVESIVYKSNSFAIGNKKIECIDLAVVASGRRWAKITLLRESARSSLWHRTEKPDLTS